MQNDNEIIKALDCCRKKECNTCPCYDDEIECGEMLIGHTLDLINSQKAEIERLTKCRKEEVEKLMTATDKVISEAKNEAIKEFERRIKAHAYYIDVPKEHRVVDEDDIDAILKEMTEVKANE